MRNLKYIFSILIIFTMCNDLVGCINKKIVNLECENLYLLSEQAYGFENDRDKAIIIIEQYLDALQKYIMNNENFDCLENNRAIYVYRQNHGNNYIFNLIRYDGNQIVLGTLQRTWAFLQVIINDEIKVYKLYDRASECPLNIKVLDLPSGNYIISVSGVTNVSRRNTAFISFWEYSLDGLKEYTDIILNSNYENDKLFTNMYYIEYFHDNNVQIINSNKELGFFDVIGSDFAINSYLHGDKVIIDATKLK